MCQRFSSQQTCDKRKRKRVWKTNGRTTYAKGGYGGDTLGRWWLWSQGGGIAT